MKGLLARVIGVAVALVGIFVLTPAGPVQANEAGIPERPHAPSKCEVVILPVPGPSHCYPTKPPVDDPVSILPVPSDPPVSILPVDRFRDLRLWIVRKGEGRRSVVVRCGPRCSVGQSLLRASQSLPARNCRAVPGTVRAGAFWQGRRIGPFHNYTTCRASQWMKVSPIYNNLLP